MSVTVLVGAQFGDEGKGKIVDYLAKDMDMVVRFQGGDNAGHTVVNDKGSFKLHLVPCGIFKDGCKALANTGMVINPDELMKELAEIEKGGVDTSLMYISSRAVILMPYHHQARYRIRLRGQSAPQRAPLREPSRSRILP